LSEYKIKVKKADPYLSELLLKMFDLGFLDFDANEEALYDASGQTED
jgi:hypothetical protein